MRYGSDLPEPYVPHVKVPDMGAINTNALAGAVNMGRIQDMGYERGARSAYDNALAGGASEMDAVGAMRQQGYGSQAGKVQDNVLARQSKQADMAGKLDEFIRQRSPLAQSQDDWNLVLDEAVGRFGLNPGAIPQTLKAWTPDLGKKLALGGLSAAQQVELEFKKAQEARAQAAEGRAAGLYPGQVAAQGAALSHAQGAEQRAQELHPYQVQNAANKGQKIINIPDPSDPFGQKKIPHVYDPATGEATPVQVAPQDGGQAPAPQGQADTPPAEVAAKIAEGQTVTFGNGQQWSKKNGQLVRVK